MTISEAKAQLVAAHTTENMSSLMEAVAAAVSQTSVLVPIQRDGSRIRPMFAQHRGEVFAALYTSPEKAGNATTGTVPFSSLIDMVYSSARIAGLLLDPGESEVAVTRRMLHENTSCKDPRLEKRDWGTGVPSYQPEDRMVIEELMDFAMEVAASAAAENGFALIDSSASPVFLPNYILEKDGELYFVLVEISIAPDLPKLSDSKRQSLLDNAAKHGAHCLYAPISIGSKDEGRFNAGLALSGDDFMVNFAGFIPLG